MRSQFKKRSHPEERVRQILLEEMTQKLGYPKALIAVEKELKFLVPWQEGIPQRRVDILSFDYETRPLLLIECKAHPIDEKAVTQVIGYNAYIKAPVIGLAQPNAILLGWKKGRIEEYKWHTSLPTFEEVIKLR